MGGDHAVGRSPPTEAQFAGQFKVSRTVTREALKMLNVRGLVLAWPCRGTIVQEEGNGNLLDADVLARLLDRNVSIPLVKDFRRLRLVVEPAEAELEAARKADVAEIVRAVSEMKRATAHSREILGVDSLFHTCVLRVSGKAVFAQMAPMVDTALRMTIRITSRITGVKSAGMQDHVDILGAISAGQPILARDLSVPVYFGR